MNSRVSNFPNVSKARQVLPFCLGILFLIGTWDIIFASEALFAESHLASYYCCLTPQELQKIGTLERTVSEFFHAFPGEGLPGVLFISANLAIFVSAWRKTPKASWLPFVFVLFNFLYVLVDFAAIALSWTISNAIVGPQITPYKGYYRTWYGIVLHFVLWGVFLFALVKSSRMVTAHFSHGHHYSRHEGPASHLASS